MTSALEMIQLYNVPATNRTNLPGNSTPQKTITVDESISKSGNYAAVLGFSSRITIETRKVKKYFSFSCFSSTSGNLNCCQNAKNEKQKKGEVEGRKNRNRKNDKGFVNYAL